jgi:hypothetical protein
VVFLILVITAPPAGGTEQRARVERLEKVILALTL